MDYRILGAWTPPLWALGLGLVIAAAHADEPSSKEKPNSTPSAARPDDSNANSDLAQLLERLNAQLSQIADKEGEAESREATETCRELVASIREILHKQNAKSEAAAPLPQALEAIRQVECDGENCPIDGKLVENQDLRKATLGEIFAKLRDVEVTDEEREELANEAEDNEAELAEVVAEDDGDERTVWVVQTTKKRGRRSAEVATEKKQGEEAQSEENEKHKPEAEREFFMQKKPRAEAAERRLQMRELETFTKSIAARVQEAMRIDNPAERVERLREIVGAIRERAADVVENDAERAFDLLRNAERIESQAREIAERFGGGRLARLQRGEQDEPPARPQPGMGPPGMMGPPPGSQREAMANVPPDPRGKAMMAQRLLMAAGLKKEAQMVGEAIEREFAVDPATVRRLRAEIAELQTANARLKAALENREAALKEQIQARRKAPMKEDRDEDEEEDEDEGDDEEEEEEDDDERND